ncbi:DNA helicase [Xylanimonas oleitrophica]|uniref:DNA helicase n=1 Tax=Xylanimonas oleitrophica TaxID=2607479 RepID=A0A2W5Y4M1_9MICO|nr:bifunctional RecB family nuclease/DEAD/DEAH box helicase [Xylanimonas oleitrophica]PZR52924.1 DNA helicase [Xylanimonas oleitrophica]
MYLLGDDLVLSASDLTAASACELAFLRTLDARLGRLAADDAPEDPMLARTSALGAEHELRVLGTYEDRFGPARDGGGVAVVDRPSLRDPDAVAAALAATRDAFASGADVVYQAMFAEPGAEGRPGFVGFADFVVRRPDGRYRVQDTKLARQARVTALLQLAAYASRLEALGVPVDDHVELVLGDGHVSTHRLADVEPVYRLRRAHLERIVGEHLADPGRVVWGDPRYTACGRCAVCDAEVQAHRDVLLVAGLRASQRARLAAAGIVTIDDLAASTGRVEGIGTETIEGLREQARLQLEADRGAGGGVAPDVASDGGAHGGVDGGAGTGPDAHAVPPVRVVDAAALAVIPPPDPGDVFFDFEGDPLYTEGDGTRWGLDYLFGLVEADGTFRAWWAHTFAEEKQALLGFLDYLRERRRAHPRMHVYHYAAYERTHLLSIAARHGVGEDEVDQILREHVLVDLYPVVRRGLRVGSRSYSIKKLEPLYMGDDLRSGDVQTAGASIEEYARARQAVLRGDTERGQRLLDAIADYNEYDCRSTLALRDWLLGLAAEHGIAPEGDAETAPGPDVEPSPLARALLARAGDPLDPDRTDDERAAGMAASAIDYHRREQKSFWWGHFSRLVEPLADWAETRDVLRVDGVRVLRDWYREGKQRSDRRLLELRGEWGPGSRPSVGGQAGPYLLYEPPGPYESPTADPGARSARTVRVVEVLDDATVVVEESLPPGAEPHQAVPSALTPAAPPRPGTQVPAIEEWAQAIVDAGDVLDTARADAGVAWPRDAVVDILRRTRPRTRSGSLAPVLPDAATGEPDHITAVVRSLLDLDGSYLAVQGPPGTGKTYLAARVVRRLVERHRWRIGVVAQSHAVVEHLLEGVVGCGLDPDLVGKEPQDPEADVAFTALKKSGYAAFAQERQSTGFVLGGTAWDFSNPERVPRRSLDLLVVDEAGQYSLGSTVAASVAAHNLLLLGDPQQLPQVSQGTHPEPIDTSALGWVTDGHDVLPPELGYFLAASRRMHPAVSGPVSVLSYEGQLRSHPCASQRSLDGVDPGLHVRPVRHTGRSTDSPEEAAEVVEIVRGLLGRAWSDAADAPPRPFEPRDVIVVTPYNAQVQRVREVLARAGLAGPGVDGGGVRVGTVDKFQGQEAVVAIVSMCASDAAEVPRGMEFLLLKNRLNVAISRAQWAAYVVHSPGLLEHLPSTPAGLAQLSAFVRLVAP